MGKNSTIKPQNSHEYKKEIRNTNIEIRNKFKFQNTKDQNKNSIL